MATFIWRDSRDLDTFHIGLKRDKRWKNGESYKVENEYMIYVTLHGDLLSDLLDRDVWNQVKTRVTEQPREVHLSLLLPSDTDCPTNKGRRP